MNEGPTWVVLKTQKACICYLGAQGMDPGKKLKLLDPVLLDLVTCSFKK